MDNMESANLKQLISRCALGDQQSFHQLYVLSSSKLNGVAFRIMQNTDLANEVLQEAFIQIWHKAGEYKEHLAEPMTWMSSIVRYRAFDRLKLEKRRIEGQCLDTSIESVESIVDKSTEQDPVCGIDQQLEGCLQQLEEIQRESILMAYYYGFSRDEISVHFDTPVNTVKSWLRRGLGRLQQCLSN